MMSQALIEKPPGVILVGGKARRMGGADKCLMELGGKTLLSRIIERLEPQISDLALSINGSVERFEDLDLSLLRDGIPDYQGPLVGIWSALEWALSLPDDPEWVFVACGDTPFLPSDIITRLLSASIGQATRVIAPVSAGRIQYLSALWRTAQLSDLIEAITKRGVRAPKEWVKPDQLCEVAFSEEPLDPFFNINTQDDLDAARAIVGKEGA